MLNQSRGKTPTPSSRFPNPGRTTTAKTAKQAAPSRDPDEVDLLRDSLKQIIDHYRPDQINDSLLRLLSMAVESRTFETLSTPERSDIVFLIQLLSKSVSQSVRVNNPKPAEISKAEQMAAGPEPIRYTINEYAAHYGIKMCLHESAYKGKQAAELCRKLGYSMVWSPDPTFSSIGRYPESVLRFVFFGRED